MFCAMFIVLISGCPMPEPVATAPGTMAAPTLEVGNGELIATWTAPDDGGSAITGYELQYSSDGGTIWSEITEITETSYSISPLTNGASYEVQVRAVNAVGKGPWSPSAMEMAPNSATQVPAGTETSVIFSDDIGKQIATENLSVSLTTGAYAVDESGGITLTIVPPPAGVIRPTVDADTGIITVTAGTTAGTYLLYGENGTSDVRFAEYFSVTVSPQNKTELGTLITEGIDTWGNTANLNYIITTEITDMSSVFNSNTTFNGNISGWDVSSVTFMNGMFASATAFNGDISGWDVSKVGNMNSMFYTATAFNGDISGWDVSSVTNMGSMFYLANEFNGDISLWNVSSVTFMGGMFYTATAFNNDISGWDVSSVTNMGSMFFRASAFNQDLEDWGEHWTLNAAGKYTGTKTNTFLESGVVTNTDGSDTNKPTGVGVPSWY